MRAVSRRWLIGIALSEQATDPVLEVPIFAHLLRTLQVGSPSTAVRLGRPQERIRSLGYFRTGHANDTRGLFGASRIA
jgi:hypothetical protein